MRRLAFIRLLTQQGLEQSKLPDPLAASCILTFHDAVELFLMLASEHRGITVQDKGTDFVSRYFGGMHPDRAGERGVDLAGRLAIKRLTTHRNAFKHEAAHPTGSTVTQARTDATQFFEDNTPRVFGIPFTGIDMADLIPQPQTRAKVKQAAGEESAGRRLKAMAWLVEAFDELLETATAPGAWRGTPFSFGTNIRYPLDKGHVSKILRQPSDRDRYTPARGAANLAEEYVAIRNSVNALQRGARLTAMGIDYSEYWRFNSLTPTVYRGSPHEEARITADPRYAPDAEEFAYCQQFVVAAALRIAEVMNHRRPPSWEQ